MQHSDRVQMQEQSQQLMNGPLKHIRAAALAAALVPLASVFAAPASAQTTCASGGTVCGFVWNDANNNGLQDAGETGIEGAVVSIRVGTDTLTTDTGPDGVYYFFVPEGTYTIGVVVPQGMATAPSNVGVDDAIDSDGVLNGFGASVATATVVGDDNHNTDFGFVTSAATNPGTGTPGYWKNHPDAWPVDSITVGGVTYTKAEAIAWLGKVGKDKTTTMFSSLVPAKLNMLIGNDGSCVNAAIAAGDVWMTTHPVGTNVAASSPAWSDGEPIHQTLDAYNNGLLCAPHRQ